MILLGLDLETTGLDPKMDKVLEVGSVTWDTEINEPVELSSMLVSHDDLCEPKPDHPCPQLFLTSQKYGYHPDVVLRRLLPRMSNADAVIAHNGIGFDKLFIEAWSQRDTSDLTWVDTTIDVPYPIEMTTRRLIYLAAEHGFLNPFAHRAVFDVMTMMIIASRYGWDEIIASAKTPIIEVRAIVSYNDRELAKSRGYRWDPLGKIWRKSLREKKLSQERQEAKFNVEVIK